VGEQVDILSAIDKPHMDVDEEPSLEEEEDDDAITESIPSVRRHQRPTYGSSRYTSATNNQDRLLQINNDEWDNRLNGERDDVRI
jgi:hypothetical protein